MFVTLVLRKNLLVSGRILRSMVLFFYYNIRTDPLLGIGYVDFKWIPCSFYSLLSKLDYPCNIRKDKYNQDQ